MITTKRLALSATTTLVHRATHSAGARLIVAPANDGKPILIGGPDVSPTNGYPLLRRDVDVHRTIHLDKGDELWALAPDATGTELSVLIVEPGA